MSHLLNTPQFKYPFHVMNGSIHCVEQDSPDDHLQNAVTVMRYRKGDRSALPEFGIPDPTFRMGGIHPEEIEQAVRTWEPDVDIQTVRNILDQAGNHQLNIDIAGHKE